MGTICVKTYPFPESGHPSRLLHRAGVLVSLAFCIAFAGCAPEGIEALKADSNKLEAPAKPVPQNGQTYLSLGKRLLAANESELAMKAFLQSMSTEGVTAEAMTGAGLAAESQGLMSLARRYFEQARDLAPNSIVARNNLGVVLYRLKQYDLARDEFRTAFALSSGRSEIAERNLNLSEAKIAANEAPGSVDATASYEVVRLGTSEFRLTESRADGIETMGTE